MIGKAISHYRILEHLGGGGMGVVYKAEDIRLKRTVALKFLPPALTTDPEAKERFIHEAQAASSLDHPNICNIHEIGETDDGQLFIVMTCYDGGTLKKRIEQGPLLLSEAIDIALQVARGLQAAHEAGMVHRDVKPANIMLTAKGEAKILDFGLAKLAGQAILTKAGSTVGTAAYVSPEQARGEEVDQRSDIFSLGVVLYEMITGHRPFKGEHEAAMMYSLMNETPEPLARYKADVPNELQPVIDKTLAKERENRYQHVDELIVDLRTITAASTYLPAASSRTAAPRRRWTRSRLLLTGAGVLVVAFCAWFFLGRESGEMSQLRKKSIAVLPFSPFGRSFDDSIFADGIHDDILTQLSKIGGMRVIARTSMLLYRDSKKTPHQIGNDLDVGYLLEGSTRRSGGKIRITAQLIKTADEGHLWAETYDRNDADVFAVQSDIAQRIAASMEAVLSPAEKASVEEIPTTNTEAYNYYLRGNYYWDNYMDSVGNARAAECYEKAAQIDPTFTQAFARIAVVNSAIYSYIGDRTPARLARITSALDKARALNPDDPVLHWAQSDYFLNIDTAREMTDRFKMALEEIQKALRARPNWAELHLSMGIILWDGGALPEARESFRRYFSLSPMSLSGMWDPWTVSFALKEYDVARREVDEYIARRPDDPYGYQSKAWILDFGLGDLEGARAVLEDGMKLSSNQYRRAIDAITTNDFWDVYYLGGRYQDALACLVKVQGENVIMSWSRWLRKGVTYMALNQHNSAMACFDSALSFAERSQKIFWRHFRTGMILAWRGDHEKAALELENASKSDMRWWERKYLEEAQVRSALLAGDTDRALSLLEQLIPQPGFLTVWVLRRDPMVNPLRSNPRFKALLTKYTER